MYGNFTAQNPTFKMASTDLLFTRFMQLLNENLQVNRIPFPLNE